MSILCQNLLVFSWFSSFLPQGKLTGCVRIITLPHPWVFLLRVKLTVIRQSKIMKGPVLVGLLGEKGLIVRKIMRMKSVNIVVKDNRYCSATCTVSTQCHSLRGVSKCKLLHDSIHEPNLAMALSKHRYSLPIFSPGRPFH